MEKERKEERGKKKAKTKVMVRDTFIMGEGGGDTETITFLEGSQASTACLPGKSSRKMELCVEGKKGMHCVLTVVA